MSRRDGTPLMQVFGRVLARELGLGLEGVDAVQHRARLGAREVVGTGPSVRLDGLAVTRLEFERPADALDYLVHALRPERDPAVGDARGRQLVIVSGPRLTAGRRAARALSAAWAGEVLAAEPSGVEAVRVLSPPEAEGVEAVVEFESALLLGRPGSPAYAHMIERLRAARAHTRLPPEQAGAARVVFVSTNHFTFESGAGSATGYSEVALTKDAGVAFVARTPERARVLARFARELLELLPAGKPPERPPERPPAHPDDRAGDRPAGPALPPRDRMSALCTRVVERLSQGEGEAPDDALGGG